MDDTGTDAGTGTGLTGSVDTGATSGTMPPAPDFNALVPSEFKEELWVKDIARSDAPIKTLFDQLKHAQTMIGQRKGVEIPGDNAAPETIQAWHKALGVPDSPDKYEYKAADVSSESETVKSLLAEEAKDDTFIKTMRQVAHQAGVTPKQFQALATAVDGWKVENARGIAQMAEQQKETRATKFNEIYGDKAPAVEKAAKDVLSKVVPQNILDTGDPELVLFEAMRYIHEKVFKGDSIAASDGAGSGFTGTSRAQLHVEIMKLRQEQSFTDPFHPNHAAMRAKVDDLYKQMLSLSS